MHRVTSKKAEVLTYLVSVSPNEREEGTLTLLVPVKNTTGKNTNLEYVSTIQVEQRSAAAKPVILYTKPTLVKQAKPTTISSQPSGSGSGSTGSGSGSGSSGSGSGSGEAPQYTNDVPVIEQGLNQFGDAVVGSTLTATTGTWTGTAPITYAYQWKDCTTTVASCVAIPGATSTTYTPTESDVGYSLNFVVTATNAVGTDSWDTIWNDWFLVVGALQNDARPVVFDSSGIGSQPHVGDNLSVTDGDWTGNPGESNISFQYEWEDCNSLGGDCTTIPGARSQSYTPQDSDIGFTLEAVVIAQDNAGVVSSAESGATKYPVVEAAPELTFYDGVETPNWPVLSDNGVPVDSFSAAPVVGDRLSVTSGTWISDTTPSISYKWEDCATTWSAEDTCTLIPGANAATYTVGEGDVGSILVVDVTATNLGGSTTAEAFGDGQLVSAP